PQCFFIYLLFGQEDEVRRGDVVERDLARESKEEDSKGNESGAEARKYRVDCCLGISATDYEVRRNMPLVKNLSDWSDDVVRISSNNQRPGCHAHKQNIYVD